MGLLGKLNVSMREGLGMKQTCTIGCMLAMIFIMQVLGSLLFSSYLANTYRLPGSPSQLAEM